MRFERGSSSSLSVSKVSYLSTAKTLAGVTLCAILSTSCRTKFCFLRSFYKISQEELAFLQTQKEKIAITYLDTFTIPESSSESIRENMATLIAMSYHRIMESQDHWMRKLFTSQEILEGCCMSLVRCNFEKDSRFLQLLLESMDLHEGSSAKGAYQKALEIIHDEDEDDIDFDDIDCDSFKMIIQNPNFLIELTLEERESLAEEVVAIAVFLLKNPKKDPNPVLSTFCGINGVLERCNLPSESKSLKEILSDLDELTKGKASFIYLNRQNLK